MSSSIQSSIWRGGVLNHKAKFEYKKENGKIYRAERITNERKDIGNCYHCHLPVYASSGQAIKHYGGKPTHKACRKAHK